MARSVNPDDAMGDDVLGNFKNAPPHLRGQHRKGKRRGRRKSKRS